MRLRKCKVDINNLQGHKIQIYPTKDQIALFNKYFGACRYIYNWALDVEEKVFKEEKRFVYLEELQKLFTIHRNSPGNEWLLEIPVDTSRHALRNAVHAYIRFFDKTNNRPKYKEKKKSRQSFATRNDRFYLTENAVRIEGLPRGDKIKCKHHHLQEEIKNKHLIYYNPTISTDGYGRYYLSFQIPKINPISYTVDNKEVIGIDVGMKNFAYCSDGTIYNMPNIDKEIRRLKRAERKCGQYKNRYLREANCTRTKYDEIPKSNRYYKRLKKSHDIRKRISNICNNTLHTITNEIVSKAKAIVVENVRSCEVINTWSTKSIYLSSMQSQFYSFKNMLRYKCEHKGVDFVVADKYYPSSQLCSSCGHRMKIGGERVYKCPECGQEIDRDYNAAINLRNYYFTI